MKRMAVIYLSFWLGTFLVSFMTASDTLPLYQRILYTGILALVAPLLSMGQSRTQNRAGHLPKVVGYDADIHLPLDSKVLYRIRGNQIYKGMNAAPIYELKGNKVYPIRSSKFIYRIEGEKIYRGWEVAPVWAIKGDKIYPYLDSKVAYEIRRKK